VTLVVAVPALGTALLAVWRGSVRAQLVWVGMLAAFVYTYAYYLFGAAFNDAFLLHVAVFSSSLFALVFAVSTLDVADIGRRFGPRTPARWIGGLLAVLAVDLGTMWVFYSLRFAVTGDIPAGSALVETDTIVHLGYALDLALLVPAYALAAVLLWRRAAWGFVLSIHPKHSASSTASSRLSRCFPGSSRAGLRDKNWTGWRPDRVAAVRRLQGFAVRLVHE
jgi:hypothetical protein